MRPETPYLLWPRAAFPAVRTNEPTSGRSGSGRGDWKVQLWRSGDGILELDADAVRLIENGKEGYEAVVSELFCASELFAENKNA